MLEIHNINTRIHYIKYCLLAFTVLFSLTGLSLVIIGSTINAVFTDFSFFLDTKYFTPAIFLYSIGFVVFGVSIIGLIGALKENTWFITTYGILLGVIFILQVATGMSTNILLKSPIYEQLEKQLASVFSEYYTNEQNKEHFDALQQSVGCCGVTGPNDWNKLILPPSCCAKRNVDDSCKMTFQRGCVQVLEYVVNDIGSILASTAYVLALMQLAGACFALYLGNSLRKQKLAKDFRRWLLTNEILNCKEGDELTICKK
ncbi:23 kDa integral membrane protein-like [Rhodnius prolixus]|uniref:Tetraspanin n=2 Tax=Rhodnius TaxID=13248 RepID=R4G3H1_RHOPR